MWWDIGIGTALAVFVVFTTVLGGQLASRESWHKWAFYLSGLAMLVLTVAQTVRTSLAQIELDKKLGKIERNTEQPPVVNVQSTSPVVVRSPKQRAYVSLDRVEIGFRDKRTLGLNVYSKNSTNVAATNYYSLFRVHPVPAENADPKNVGNAYPTRATIEKYWADFEKFFNSTKFVERYTLGPGEGRWGSAFIENFDDELRSQLDSGLKVILILKISSFSDEAGPHVTDFCRWIQAPLTPEQPIIHTCGLHDGIRR